MQRDLSLCKETNQGDQWTHNRTWGATKRRVRVRRVRTRSTQSCLFYSSLSGPYESTWDSRYLYVGSLFIRLVFHFSLSGAY